MIEKCVECGLDDPKPMHRTEKGLLCDICFKAEEIWQLWREGKIDHDEVQKRLDKILPQEPEGFYKNLKETLSLMVSDRIPHQSKRNLDADAYFSRRNKIEKEIVTETDWSNFWQNCKWLKQPSEQDVKILLNLNTEDLTKFHVLIFKSLVDMAKQDLEDSEPCKILHEFYKFSAQEMCDRGILKNPEKDAFYEYCQNKQTHIEQENLMEDARATGKICIHCGSQNVRSYNKQEWKCYDCGKRFRKH